MKPETAINSDEAKYQARAWRTDVFRKEASREVLTMLQAFIPEGFIVSISECDEAVPGFPHAARYRQRGILHDPSQNGSDAHFYVLAYTREGVIAKLLAHILDGQGFFPLT